MGGFKSKVRNVDFYKKLPSDLTEATLAGASISLVAAGIIILLVVLEFSAFVKLETKSELVVDRSRHGELLRINFNMSFPALSCEFATLDVSDALGTKRLNLTKTVRKLPISADLERKGYYMHDDQHPDVKYDSEEHQEAHDMMDDTNWSTPVTKDEFKAALQKHPIAVFNFYAPWCPWCQRLEPTWEAVTAEVHKRYPEHDGRIRFGKVDCTREQALCQEHQITGFPSIRVFRKGSDEISLHGMHEHESYRGDRTKDSLLEFAEALIPSAGQPHRYVRGVTRMAKTPGCNLSGFVLVKKVPGTLHFLAKSPGHSFDFPAMNMSHVVHQWYFGNKPSPRRRAALARLHPMGLTDDWADKLSTQPFISANQRVTHEHYSQVVLTTIDPNSKAVGVYDAYEYTVHSHQYTTEDIPAARFSYELSPIQIWVSEKHKAWYHFITTLCAIIGGVFVVAGIIDGLLHSGHRMIAKKLELGKQG
jgi:thiol-disulfide isomerase/thioredoxin